MKPTRWAVLAVLCGLAGCLPANYTQQKSTPEKMQALNAANSGYRNLVEPEQVNERNAHDQCNALNEELDREQSKAPH